MIVIKCRNVNEALKRGTQRMLESGVEVGRNGVIMREIDEPVTTVYQRPWERALISKCRDANPFFHLMESIWILAGRQDVKFLSEFNSRIADYSDDGKVFNAPYGYRMRNGQDQVRQVINQLRENTGSRQAVIQIWDKEDLAKGTKDKACNLSVVFSFRRPAGQAYRLAMTVYNRSNDMLWGAYGANVVQFSMLQEYVASALGVPMGSYTQVSNNLHVYTSGPGGELWEKVWRRVISESFPDYDSFKLVQMQHSETASGQGAFDKDLRLLFRSYDMGGLQFVGGITEWESAYFKRLIMPVLCTFLTHKLYGASKALEFTHQIEDDSWRIACEQWLTARIKN